MSPDRKLRPKIDLPDDLKPQIIPPIFPRTWTDYFEAEFSHDDPEICHPPGCSQRLKQIFAFTSPDREASYCGYCKQLLEVNVHALRLIYGAQKQHRHDVAVEALIKCSKLSQQ